MLVAALLLTTARTAATTIYGSPNGNDKWSGRIAEANARKTDGPLASLVAARDAIRKLKGSSPATVIVAAGRYRMPETLVLTSLEGGT